jgi:signal transduction histidine kinase
MLQSRIFTGSVLKGIVFHIICCIAMPFFTKAQLSQFRHISSNEGLPSNYVFSVSEDENGFLWAGTDKGLAVFNGISWKTYTTEQSLPGNYINQVICTGKGGLWLGISGKGLYYLDLKTWTFTLNSDLLGPEGFSTGPGGSVFFVYGEDADLSVYGASPEAPAVSVLQFKITKCSHAYSWNAEKKQLIIFSKQKDTAVHGISYLEKSWSKLYISIPTSIPDRGRYKRANDSVYFDPPYVLLFPAGGPAYMKTMAWNPGLKAVIIGVSNGYWVYDKSGSVVFADKAFNQVSLYDQRNGLATTLVESISYSSKGYTLFCTMGSGIQLLLPRGNRVLTTRDARVTGIDIAGDIAYAVTPKELKLISLSGKSDLKTFTHEEKEVMNVQVFDGRIYISSLYGIGVYEIKGDRLIKKEMIPVGAGVSSVLPVSNTLLLSTYGNGIQDLALMKKTMKFRPVGRYPVIEKMQLLRNGYAAYDYENGVYIFDRQQQEQAFLSGANGLPASAVFNLFEEGDSTWISTAKGVALIKGFKVIKTFPVKAGGLTRCMACFRDREMRLWMVSNKGLWRFDGNRFIATNSNSLIENKEDQIVSVMYDTVSNTLLTGTMKQLVLTNMGELRLNKTVESPRLLYASADENDFSQAGSHLFPYNTDNIRFHFKPALTSQLSGTLIYYRLDGLANEWNLLSDSLGLSFHKLRSGQYRLLARTVNPDGFESEETELIQFSIRPPFWQEGWFIVLVLFGSVLLTYLLTKLYQLRQRKQLNKENRLKEQLLKERERISRELHDNLGASLTTIIAQTDNIETQLLRDRPEEALKKTLQLSEHSRETVNILRETIWAVQENEHSLDEYILRVKNYLQRMLTPVNIEWQVNTIGTLEKKLSPVYTLHLFRIVQEVTQNIIKHAEAKQVEYAFNTDGQNLRICITDNGKGFDAENAAANNGLKNIQHRTDEMNGTCNIHSSDAGTRVELTIKI